MDTPSSTRITNQGVAVLALVLAAVMTFGAFWLSRADHDLKLMSLQSVLTLGGTLTGIAGTLLVGVQAYKSLTTGDLPPGSSLKTSEQNEIKVPPTTTLTSSASSVVPSNPIAPISPSEAPKL